MTYKPVDTAITMVVGPCIDDTDFKSLEEAIAYNAAGMDVSLIVEKIDGTTAVTAITLTTGGTSDWTHKDGGYYEIEVTAAQNAEEGVAYIRGVCTGVLPFESAHYNIVKANVYDSLIKGTDLLQIDLTQIGGGAQSATDLKDFADAGYDPATNKITGTADMRGTDSAALASEALTNATWTNAKAVALGDWINGGRLDVILDAIVADTNELQGDWKNTGRLDNLLDACNTITPDAAGVAPTAGEIKTAIEAAGSHLALIMADTNELQLDWKNGGRLDALIDLILGDTSELQGNQGAWATAAGFSTHSAADVKTAIEAAGSSIAQILTDTDNLQTNQGAWATAAGFSTHSAADVKTAIEAAGSSLAQILTDTNELQTDWKNTGRLDAILDTIAADTTTDLPALINALNNISAANVKTEAVAALADIKLDHLINIAVDTDWGTTVHLDSVIGHMADVGTAATFDRTQESMEALRNRGDSAWVTGGGGAINDILNVQDLIPNSIDLANTATVRIGLGLTNMVDDLPSTAEIIPGTITIDRKAIGGTSWSNVVNAAACSELAGLIYYDEVFDTGTGYAAGDSIRVTFKSQKITVDANDFEITGTDGWVFQTYIREAMVGTAGANTTTPPTVIAIREEMDSNSTKMAPSQTLADYKASGFSTHNAADVKTAIEAVGSSIATILSDTNELQTDWANGGRLDLILDRLLDVVEVRYGLSVNDAAASTTKFISTMTEGVGFPWDRAAVLFTSGANDGLMRRIKSYNGTTKEITVQTPLLAAPADGDTFVMPAIRAFMTPDIEDIADQVMDELTAEHPDAGSLSKAITDILEDTANLQGNQGDWTTATSVTVSDKTGFTLSAAGADAILDGIVEGTHTMREILRLLTAAMVGKSSGGGTATVTFRDIDDTKDRIVATVTTVGNRTTVTLTED